MVPTHILDILMELLPAKASVSIYGDSYQLPPVEGDPIDPYWYTENITTLSTQYRAEAPEVIETFTRFVQYLQHPSSQADLTLNKKIKKGSLDSFNPATDRALAYTNDETVAINNRIAKMLNLPRDISIGETVFINGLMGKLVKSKDEALTIYPSCIAKGVLMSGDKLQNKIDEVVYNINKFDQRIVNGRPFYIEIEEVTYRFFGNITHYKHNKKYKQEVENTQLELIKEYSLDSDIDLKVWCRENKNKYSRARGKAWSTYLAHQNLVFDLRRPFCTTIHRAQGSEFDTIYLAQDDIKKAIRGNHYEQYARLMYVALSRAIHKVVII